MSRVEDRFLTDNNIIFFDFMNNHNIINFDNAASTSLYPEVIDVMINSMKNSAGNPSANHSLGQDSKSIIESSRKRIAKYLNCLPQEIIFTSCATESNNLIIHSACETFDIQRIITTEIEHKSVLKTCLEIQKDNPNLEIKNLSCNELGEFKIEELEEFLKENKKTLVCLMHANNEIGNLIDLKEITDLCKKYNALIHSDIVQTFCHLNINLDEIKLDFASISAHKFHGPKGIGFAFIRKDKKIKPQIFGGGQERGVRSGTENIYGIVGMEKAIEISLQKLNEHKNYITELKKYAINQLKNKIPNIKFTGNSADLDKSLFTILNVLLPFKYELLSFELNMKGICVSQGSACNSGASKLSNVLDCILPKNLQNEITPLRISFSYENTFAEIDIFIESLSEIIISQNQ